MDVRELKDKASQLFSKGKFAKAAETYEEYCRADSKDLQARLRLGDAWSKAGKKDKAVAAYAWAAEGFAKDGFLPRAIAASKLVLEHDPAHKGVQKMLADLYAQKSSTPSRISKLPSPAGFPEIERNTVDLAAPVGDELEAQKTVQTPGFAPGFGNRADAIDLDAPSGGAAKKAPVAPAPASPSPSPMNRADAIDVPEFSIPLETGRAGGIGGRAATSGPSPTNRADAIVIELDKPKKKGPAPLEVAEVQLDLGTPAADEVEIAIEEPTAPEPGLSPILAALPTLQSTPAPPPIVTGQPLPSAPRPPPAPLPISFELELDPAPSAPVFELTVEESDSPPAPPPFRGDEVLVSLPPISRPSQVIAPPAAPSRASQVSPPPPPSDDFVIAPASASGARPSSPNDLGPAFAASRPSQVIAPARASQVSPPPPPSGDDVAAHFARASQVPALSSNDVVAQSVRASQIPPAPGDDVVAQSVRASQIPPPAPGDDVVARSVRAQVPALSNDVVSQSVRASELPPPAPGDDVVARSVRASQVPALSNDVVAQSVRASQLPPPAPGDDVVARAVRASQLPGDDVVAQSIRASQLPPPAPGDDVDRASQVPPPPPSDDVADSAGASQIPPSPSQLLQPIEFAEQFGAARASQARADGAPARAPTDDFAMRDGVRSQPPPPPGDDSASHFAGTRPPPPPADAGPPPQLRSRASQVSPPPAATDAPPPQPMFSRPSQITALPASRPSQILAPPPPADAAPPPGLRPKKDSGVVVPPLVESSPPTFQSSPSRIRLPTAFASQPSSGRIDVTPVDDGHSTDLERSLQAFMQIDAPQVMPPSPAASFTELEIETESLLHAVEAAAHQPPQVEEAMEPLDDPKPEAGALPRIPLFSDLPADAFIALFEQCPLRRFDDGQTIIEQGTTGESFFVICAGRVRVFRTDGASRREVAALDEGAFFGEMALLSDAPRSASVIAGGEDTQVLEISAQLLKDLSAKYPSVAQALKKFCRQRLLSNLMASAPLFRPFSRSDRRDLIQKFRAREVRVGDVVVREGTACDGLYVVLSGEVEVRVKGARVASLREGEIFGEMSLLTKSAAGASVISLRHTSLLRLPREDFDALILSYPQILEHVAELTDARRQTNGGVV